jgi:phage terminase large subunit
MIQATTALKKISQLKKPIRIVRGGQGAGKTISILIILINHCLNKEYREVFVISHELTKMRVTVIKDFINIMREIGIFMPQRLIGGVMYRFPNGSFIKFMGLDKDDAGKGFRCHVAYFNEVNKISFEGYRQISTRAQIVYADYNPDAHFFIDEHVLTRDDCDFLQLTFKDNEQLSDRERKEIMNYYKLGYFDNGEIKNKYFANLWQVYGLGNIGSLMGTVYDGWEVVTNMPSEAKLLGYGLDFGFSNSFTALVAVYKYNDAFIVDEILYKTGLTDDDLFLEIKNKINNSVYIYADSAEPKAIEALRRKGLLITATEKGTGSVVFGISIVQSKKILITQQSKNIIYEKNNYIWETDKNGNNLNVPLKKNDHAMDAIKYFFLKYDKSGNARYKYY